MSQKKNSSKIQKNKKKNSVSEEEIGHKKVQLTVREMMKKFEKVNEKVETRDPEVLSKVQRMAARIETDEKIRKNEEKEDIKRSLKCHQQNKIVGQDNTETGIDTKLGVSKLTKVWENNIQFESIPGKKMGSLGTL